MNDSIPWQDSIKPVSIGPKALGAGGDVFIIGEVGNAHDGSYNTAHAFIDAIARSRAQAVKFQTHIAAAESTDRDQFRVKFSHTDATRMDYWRRMEFSASQWKGLKDHATQAGLIFLSSPFSPQAVELLAGLDVPAWKVGSGETNNFPLIEMMARTGKPLLISTGMSYLEEVDRCVEICRSHGAPYVIFHCTSAYPCKPQEAGLGCIAELGQRYRCPVGYSDHSGDIFAPLAAVALGASAIEVHVTLSPDAFGPDVSASLTPALLKRLAEGVQAVRTMISTPLDKDAQARSMEPMRKLFCKSIVFAGDLPAGTVLGPEHLAGKKPGDGIAVARTKEFVGKALKRGVRKDQQLTLEDLK